MQIEFWLNNVSRNNVSPRVVIKPIRLSSGKYMTILMLYLVPLLPIFMLRTEYFKNTDSVVDACNNFNRFPNNNTSNLLVKLPLYITRSK